MKKPLFLLAGALLFGLSAYGSTSFPECPAVGNDTSGCEFLITITSATGAIATNFNVAVSNPDLGPFDGADDTLVGVLNNTSSTITTLSLTSNTDIFGFDGDGACSGAYGTIPGCAGATDPSGYAPLGVTFSNITANNSTGLVNFSPGLAPGGSQWFSLEEALSVTQIMPGPSPAPEPASLALFAVAFGALGFLRLRSAANR